MYPRSKAELELKPMSPDTVQRFSIPFSGEVHSQQIGKYSFSHSFITVQRRAEGFWGEKKWSPFFPLDTSSDSQGYIPLSGGKKKHLIN